MKVVGSHGTHYMPVIKHLEPQMILVLLGKRPCFKGIDLPKNWGRLGSRCIIHIMPKRFFSNRELCLLWKASLRYRESPLVSPTCLAKGLCSERSHTEVLSGQMTCFFSVSAVFFFWLLTFWGQNVLESLCIKPFPLLDPPLFQHVMACCIPFLRGHNFTLQEKGPGFFGPSSHGAYAETKLRILRSPGCKICSQNPPKKIGWNHQPGPSKGCQMVAKGCQFTIP